MASRGTRFRVLCAIAGLMALLGGYVAPWAQADGGDFSLDFVAAGPFSYDHGTGIGGAFNDRTIDETTGVVESLEGGDFACGDKVVFFTQVVTDAGATGTQAIQLDHSYSAVTTSGGPVGFVDLLSVSINAPDTGNVGLDANEAVSIASEGLDGTNYEATLNLSGLDAGDTVIVRTVVLLGCTPTEDAITGNIQSGIDAARVTDPAADAISVGQQTVPLKGAGEIALPSYTLAKTADAGTINAGDQIGYTITATNTGNVPLDDLVVTDALVPAGLTFTESPDDPACSIAAGTLTCNWGDLAVGASEDVHVVATTVGANCGTVTNTANSTTANAGPNTASAGVTITCGSVDLTKTANPAGPVSAGAVIGFDIGLSTSGAGEVDDVTVSDTLPAGLTWTINPAVTGCSITAGVLTCNFGDLTPPATRTVHVQATTDASDCGTVNNTASVSTTNDGSDEASASVVVNCPDVTVTKTANPAGPVSAGSDIGFDVSVQNSGLGTATGVTLSDTLPTGFTWVLSGTNAGACGIAAGVLSCNFGDLGPGASRSIHLQADTDAEDCGTVENTATVGATNEPTSAGTNNGSTATVTVLCSDVGVQKTANPAGPVSAGDAVGFDIVVANDSAATATGVTLEDTLPSGLTWVLSGTDAGDCGIAAGVLTCDFGDIEAGGERSIHVEADTDAADCGTLENTATIESTNEGEGTGENNSSTATVTVQCPDVTVLKTADPEGPVSAGDAIGFDIVVSNDGDGTAKGVTLEDTLPTGLTWVLSGTDAGDCGIAAGVLTCDFGDIAAGGERSIHIEADTDAADCGLVENTALVAADNEAEGDTENNDSTDDVRVDCPNVVISKVANPEGPVTAPGTIGFDIVVQNTGEGTAKAVTVTDDLPPGFEWSVAAEEGVVCSISEGVLSCELGDIAPGDDLEITLTADVTSAEQCVTVENTATVGASNEAEDDTEDNESTDSVEVICPPIEVDIVKDGPDAAHVDDEVTYTLEVTNIGDIDLVEVVVTDPRCDEDTLVRTEGDDVLSPEETWSYECTHVVTEDDDDPLPNTATVVGRDVLGRETTDDDPHEVDILHPDIEIVKTASPESVNVSGEVTFTYVVENTGDTTLFDVEVTDDILGAIGTIDELAAGESKTLEKTVTVDSTSPTRNVGTATGEDVLGREVTDDDDATIAVVAGVQQEKPPTVLGVQLPRTGTEPKALVGLGVIALLAGELSRRFGMRLRRRAAGLP